MWQKVDENWEEVSVHDAFVEYASAIDGYVFAARRYRLASQSMDRAAVAAARLVRSRRMAEAKAFLHKQVARSMDGNVKKRKFGLVTFVGILMIAAILAIVMMTNAGKPAQTKPNVPTTVSPTKIKQQR
jgi:hypothetical protein